MMDILKGLNPGQVEAVLQTDGPVLVLAGAGSGKTKAIVHRIAYLIDGGISPHHILAVTFTNKAAGEMKNRTMNMVGPVAEAVWLCTFHSLCARILRVHIEKLEPIAGRERYKSGFSIYDDEDRKKLLSNCIKEVGLEHNAESLKIARRWVSYAKLRGLEVPELAVKLTREGQSRFAAVYEQYLVRMAASNALDFDDLLGLALRLLTENEEVRNSYQTRFEYCMVDEFQDTNRVQYELMKIIAGERKNLFVVGDDDQSIYAFRGADVRNILDFEKDFPEAKVVHLDQNYRSTKSILSTACCLIAKNKARKEKQLFTENMEGTRVEFCTCATEVAEAEFVCSEVERTRRESGASVPSIAVFYRTNAQSRVVEDALLKCHIPYTIVRGLRFYERKEVKDAISYLKASINPDDDIAIERVINVPPRGIGKVSIEKIAAEANRAGCSFYAAIGRMIESDDIKPALKNKLASFFSLMETLKKAARTCRTPSGFLDHMLRETNYIQYLIESNESGEMTRAENVKELVTVAKTFEMKFPGSSPEDFAHHVALLSDIDDFDESESPVSLLTLHSAKGLEFDVVFLIGVEMGLLPHYSVRQREHVEEERRLLYVGMTRAKKRLVLTRAYRRLLFGRTTCNQESPFMYDVSPDLISKKAFYGSEIL
ncbi:MAG: UvrD-helicase domain-containing protein [Candidatus Coatesbacteria bacterium]|nr:UvrD-helicase domain-containing protein [Candidatus Coatesbacteria bacterium]